MLEVANLRYEYPGGHEALKGVSLKINDGEKIAFVGANGSGKSTLLLHIAGAVEIQSGRIISGGVKALTFSARMWDSLFRMPMTKY